MEARMAALQAQVAEQRILLADRERQVTERMAALDRRMQDVGEQLSSRDEELAARDQHILELRAQIDHLVQRKVEAPPRPDAPALSSTVSDEVERLLKAAEDSATRIEEQARAASARTAAEAERRWRELQTSLARFVGWRDRVEPQLAGLHARMHEVRSRIGEIPDRVRAAFAPLAEASAAAEAGLDALIGDLTPPLLSAPTATEEPSEPATAPGSGGATGARSSAQ
jgi:chromosome segregation ATPase